MAKLVATTNLPEITLKKNYFKSLVVAIISQQLSTKAADIIARRFIGLFSTKTFPTPEQVLKKSSLSFRKAGLSGQKAVYIKHLAKAVVSEKLNLKKLRALTDEEIIKTLVEIKGIGRWTAEMFLIFSLGRPDIFSHGDLGLKNAIRKWYKVDSQKHPKKYAKIVTGYKPYSSVASRYLWKSLAMGKST